MDPIAFSAGAGVVVALIGFLVVRKILRGMFNAIRRVSESLRRLGHSIYNWLEAPVE